MQTLYSGCCSELPLLWGRRVKARSDQSKFDLISDETCARLRRTVQNFSTDWEVLSLHCAGPGHQFKVNSPVHSAPCKLRAVKRKIGTQATLHLAICCFRRDQVALSW